MYPKVLFAIMTGVCSSTNFVCVCVCQLSKSFLFTLLQLDYLQIFIKRGHDTPFRKLHNSSTFRTFQKNMKNKQSFTIMYLLTLNTFLGQPKQPLRSLKAIANFKKAMKRKLWKRITVFSSKKGCVIILEILSFSVVSTITKTHVYFQF